MRRPDWTTLQSDLIERMGNLLIADDITDFIRLRAVCHPWRSSTEETVSRVNCLYPRNWILLSDPTQSSTEPWCFYNTSTHISYSFDLTPYLERYSLLRAFDCAILLRNNSTQGFALLNPFMRCITQLPKKIDSKCGKDPSQLQDIIDTSFSSMLTDVYVTRHLTIVLRYFSLYYLVWKPGNQSWLYAKFNVIVSSNFLFYEDRLFAVDVGKGLVQINFSNEIPQSQAEVVIPICNLPDLKNAHYLVACGGDIILVTFMPDDAYEEHYWESFEVYRLDLKEKTYDDTRNLGNYSVFLGEDRTFSVSCKSLRHIPASSIYLCKLYYGETACYNLRTNRVQFWSRKLRVRHSNLVKKLVTCCQRTYWSIIGVDEE